MLLLCVEPIPTKADPPVQIPMDLLPAAGPVKTAGDVIVARHIAQGSKIQAGGSVPLGGSIESAIVFCSGQLHVPEGSIKGGRASAYRGVSCKNAGDAKSTVTELEIGFDDLLIETVVARIPEIEKAFAKSEQFRSLLEPMLKERKDLTADQKEKISDLLCRAGEARKRGIAATQKLLQRLSESEAGAKMECAVSDTIFSGVSISFPGAKTVIGTAMKGPVKLVATRGARGVAVHATNTKTGKTQLLQLVAHEDRMNSIRATLERLEQC